SRFREGAVGTNPANPTFPVEAHEPSVAPLRPMTGRCWGECMMNNFSMFTADRMTHLKVVAVALVCATLVAGLGVAARVADGGPPRGGAVGGWMPLGPRSASR